MADPETITIPLRLPSDEAYALAQLERVHAGLARARADGKTLGRPRLDTATETAIRKALKKGGKGMRKIAVELGVATGTVQRIKAELAA